MPAGSSADFRIYVGPTFAFKLRCEGELAGGGGSIAVDCDESDGDSGIKWFDFGGLVGGGLGFDMGVATLLLDVFYNMGSRRTTRRTTERT